MIFQRPLRRPLALAAFLAAGLLAATSAFAAAPTITSFTPGSAPLTTIVTVTGTGFASPATVKFNGVPSTNVVVDSSTSVRATVPNTASTGPISVSDANGAATSTATFTVTPGVTVSTSVTPPGSVITVPFSGFSAYEAIDIYFDTADVALGSASSAGAGSESVTIPAAATPGVHWFTAVERSTGHSAQASITIRTDWTQYGFRANHRGRDAFENVISPDNVEQLEEAWRTPSSDDLISAPPTDVGGTIYAAFGDGTVHAYNEATGAQKWSFTTGGQIHASPAVVNGIVYFGSLDDYLYALDANTGALKWRYLTGNYVQTAPTVKGGIVYFGSNDAYVYALNASTGALVWKYQTGSYIFSSPAVAGGNVYIGSTDKNVYALNASTGALVWSYPTGGAVEFSPVVIGGVVYIGADDGLMYAIRTSYAELLWTYNTNSSSTPTTAAVANGTVYFGDYTGKFYALRDATGELRWSFSDPDITQISQTACVANGVVYTGDLTHTVALDAESGDLYTIFPVGSFGGPIVVNGALTMPDSQLGAVVQYTLAGARNDATSARPDPTKLRHHPLR